MRIDRWLWAARFFKTRAQAKTAIEGGKVESHQNQSPAGSTSKPKVSKELALGDVLTIRRGWTAETVIVRGLADKRGNASAARTLFEETADSVELREAVIARRRMERAGLSIPRSRPTKRDRRELRKLKDSSEQ